MRNLKRVLLGALWVLVALLPALALGDHHWLPLGMVLAINMATEV